MKSLIKIRLHLPYGLVLQQEQGRKQEDCLTSPLARMRFGALAQAQPCSQENLLAHSAFAEQCFPNILVEIKQGQPISAAMFTLGFHFYFSKTHKWNPTVTATWSPVRNTYFHNFFTASGTSMQVLILKTCAPYGSGYVLQIKVCILRKWFLRQHRTPPATH